MIAAVSWVPKGVCKPLPVPAEPPKPEEIEAFLESYRPIRDDASDSGPSSSEDDEDMNGLEDGKKLDEVATAMAAASALGVATNVEREKSTIFDIEDGLAELDMDKYDEEDEGVELFGNGGLGAAYYVSNKDDPYITNKDDDDDDADADAEDEIEDMTIKDSDLLILTARNEDDVSHLEVWIYEDDDGENNMYVHHDIMLPAFPLCISWLDCGLKGGEKGNYVAVGSMQPEIEIWDLDVLDEVEPVVVLGGQEKDVRAGKKKKKKKPKFKKGSHTDSVLGLAWNNEFRNVLASASADTSVKIWDIVSEKCEHTLQVHTDKVQSVAWNMKEPTALLSGSFDHTVALMDMRAPSHNSIQWDVNADVESIAWKPDVSHLFSASLEDGKVQGFDIRIASKSLFTIDAHGKAVCAITYNLEAPNLLATASLDKTVKLWDVTNDKPSCIETRNPKLGAIFSAAFCKDNPFLLAMGGSKGNIDVWDTMSVSEVLNRFGRPRHKRGSSKGLQS